MRSSEGLRSLLGVRTVCPGAGAWAVRAEEGTLGKRSVSVDVFLIVPELTDA